MSNLKILNRILDNITEAKKLYKFQFNLLNDIITDLNNVNSLLVKACDDIPVYNPLVITASKKAIINTLMQIDKHIGAAKLITNRTDNKYVFRLATDSSINPTDPVDATNQIIFKNTVFNFSSNLPMIDVFNIDKFCIGTKNLGEEIQMNDNYIIDIIQSTTDSKVGTIKLYYPNTFNDNFIPGDTIKITNNINYYYNVNTTYYYQIMFINENNNELIVHAMPGQVINTNSDFIIVSKYNFLDPNTTYWYDTTDNIGEKDVVCSRTFRSLNNRILKAKSKISVLINKVNIQLKSLDSYCDFINALLKAGLTSC